MQPMPSSPLSAVRPLVTAHLSSTPKPHTQSLDGNVEPLPKHIVDPMLGCAQKLIDGGNPWLALAMLKPLPGDKSPQNHFGYSSKLGLAYGAHVDTLNTSNALGVLVFRGAGQEATIEAERLSCHVGVIAAYGETFRILQDGPARDRFIAVNGEATLHAFQNSISHGLTHAVHESLNLFDKISQFGRNDDSQAFILRMLATGRLQATDGMVQSWMSVRTDPLFTSLSKAIRPFIGDLRNQIQSDENEMQTALMTWAKTQKTQLMSLEDVKSAWPFIQNQSLIQLRLF